MPPAGQDTGDFGVFIGIFGVAIQFSKVKVGDQRTPSYHRRIGAGHSGDSKRALTCAIFA